MLFIKCCLLSHTTYNPSSHTTSDTTGSHYNPSSHTTSHTTGSHYNASSHTTSHTTGTDNIYIHY